MTNSLSITLNQLNQDFYHSVARSFSQTRTTYWPGWQWLIDSFSTDVKNFSSVFDVGCGNGRFGECVRPHLAQSASYIGVDSNKLLLAEAARRLIHIYQVIDLRKIDFISEMIQEAEALNLSQSSSTHPPLEILKIGKQVDLIALFGVWHHLPTISARLQILKNVRDCLTDSGQIWLSTWVFTQNQSLMQRRVSPASIGIEVTPEDEWGKNDYILDWRRGTTAYRYCHYSSPKEMQDLFQRTGLIIKTSYQPDVGADQDNRYFVLQKAV